MRKVLTAAARRSATGIVADHWGWRWGIGVVRPFPVPHGGHLRSGYLGKAKTIRELAAKLGIDRTELARLIEKEERG